MAPAQRPAMLAILRAAVSALKSLPPLLLGISGL
jgi:hypothetical protein